MTDHQSSARSRVTRAQIEHVMARFHDRIRTHPELGPIFAEHVGDDQALWDQHLDTLNRFWRGMLLRERVYDGNPLLPHANARNVMPKHFQPWLTLLDDVLNKELPAPQARSWSKTAHRIGGTLRCQIAPLRNQI